MMVELNIIIQKVNKPENQDLLFKEAVSLDATPTDLMNANVSVRLKSNAFV